MTSPPSTRHRFHAPASRRSRLLPSPVRNSDQPPILGQRFYVACGGAGTLRRAMIASTLLEYLVPHSQRGASALPRVLPKAVREYSTFGGISPKSTRSTIPSACNSLSCCISTLSLTLPTARLNSP